MRMLLKNIASMTTVNLFKAVAQFAVYTVAALYTSPDEYGLVAFSMPFIAFISLITDLGLSTALVRQPNLTPQQAGAAFTLMLVVGVACAALLSAGSVAFGPHLTVAGVAPVLSALCVAAVFSVTAATPRALLERRLQYGTIAVIEGVSVSGAVAVSIALSIAGFGVWALVIYNVLIQLLRAVLFLKNASRHFEMNWKWPLVTPLLSFGGWVLVTHLLNFAARNADNILVGEFLGAAAVGLYGFAYQFMILPLMTITWPAGAVLLSTVSQESTTESDTRQMVGALVAVTAAATFPAMIYLVFGMEFLVQNFFAEKWRGVELIVGILAPVGAIQSVAAYNGPLLLARGEARLQFLVGVLNSIALLAAFFASVRFGLLPLVATYASVAVLASLLMIALISRKAYMGTFGIVNYLYVPVLGTAAGLAAVALAGLMDAATVGGWIAASGLYAAVILAVYGIFFRKLKGQVMLLLHKGRPSSS
jgi:O-antigen/teichoic acid export membrane protein